MEKYWLFNYLIFYATLTLLETFSLLYLNFLLLEDKLIAPKKLVRYHFGEQDEWTTLPPLSFLMKESTLEKKDWNLLPSFSEETSRNAITNSSQYIQNESVESMFPNFFINSNRSNIHSACISSLIHIQITPIKPGI